MHQRRHQYRQYADDGRCAGSSGHAGARFNEEDFARSHPAGALGARLLNNVHHPDAPFRIQPRGDARHQRDGCHAGT